MLLICSNSRTIRYDRNQCLKIMKSYCIVECHKNFACCNIELHSSVIFGSLFVVCCSFDAKEVGGHPDTYTYYCTYIQKTTHSGVKNSQSRTYTDIYVYRIEL